MASKKKANRNRKIVSKVKNKTEYKICRRCGTKNPLEASNCIKCDYVKFHPQWVKEHRNVNRAVSVDITSTNPPQGEKTERISLNKFWYGMQRPQNFNINSPEQWQAIKEIIDNDLGPKLGWKGKKELIKAVKQELSKRAPNAKAKSGDEIENLVSQYPHFSAEFLDKISEILKDADFEKVQALLGNIAKATSSYDEVFFASLKQLFDKLKSEDKTAIVTFGELLKEWNLKQITDVTKEVKRRIAELGLFIQKIEDESTYEIRGDNSIHRILERSMWLVDERYWIIQSNKQLRTFIGQELAKKHKKYEKNRPDFACGTYDNTIVIIEIKRPSHSLTIDDLDQVVNYMIIAKNYLGKKYTFKAMLVGNSRTAELESKMEFTQKIELLTYNDLVQDCKKRYSEFIKHIEGS